MDGPEVARILEAVLFANKVSPTKIQALVRNMNVDMSADVRARTDMIRKAADIYQRLPRRGSTFGQEAIVWGEVGEPWPSALRDLLKKHGVFTKQRDGSRWYACWVEAQAYYESLSTDIGNNVFYVRAEADDDHDDTDNGYICQAVRIGSAEVATHSPTRCTWSHSVSSRTCRFREDLARPKLHERGSPRRECGRS